MNASSFHHPSAQRYEQRERRYPVLALLDTLLSWSIGLAALAVGSYALLRVWLFIYPIALFWVRMMGW